MKLCVSIALRIQFISLVSFLAAVVGLSACNKNPEGAASRTYQIPWPDADGQYQLQNIEIETFNEPYHLKGQVAEILVEPSDNGQTLAGSKSIGRFSKTSSGVMVPMDFNTLQATTIYAHMERLMKLDQTLGLTAEGVWPARIGVAVNFPDDDGNMEKNQAYFIPDLNSLIFVPYISSKLPISMNAGIIAHEHFHQIFQRLVNDRIESKKERKDSLLRLRACAISEGNPDHTRFAIPLDDGNKTSTVTTRQYNFFLLRALNEGLADFYGWLYSGDPEFISPSMENLGRNRSLDNPLIPLGSVESGVFDVARHSYSKNVVKRVAYDWGTRYAQFFRRLAGALGDDQPARADLAKALLRSLPKLGEEMDAKFDVEKIDPDLVVRMVVEEMGTPNAKSCDLYNQFVTDQRPRPRGCSR